MRSTIPRSGATLTTGNIVAGVISYGFILLTARGLGPDDFGSLGVLLTFLYLASPLVQGVTTLVSRYAAGADPGDRSRITALLRSSLLTVGAYSVVGFAIYAALSPLVNSLLNIGDLAAVLIVGAACVLRGLAGVFRGGLEGISRFSIISIALTLESTLRFGLAILFMAIGFSLLRVTATYVLGAILLILVLASALPMDWRRFVQDTQERRQRTVTREAYVIGGAFLLIALLGQLDMIAAKYFLPADVAGYYAAAFNLVRGPLLMIAGGFASAMFPSVVRAGARTRHGIRILALTSAAVLAGTLVAVTACLLAPELLVRTLLGSEFMPLARWLGIFALGSSAPALLLVVARYHMARRATLLLWTLSAGVLATIVAMALYHSSPLHMVFANAAGGVVALLPLIGVAVKSAFEARRLHDAETPGPDEAQK